MGKLGQAGHDFVTTGRSGSTRKGDSLVPMVMRWNSWYLWASVMALGASAASARNKDAYAGASSNGAAPAAQPQRYDFSGSFPPIVEGLDEEMAPGAEPADGAPAVSERGEAAQADPAIEPAGADAEAPPAREDADINQEDLVPIHAGLSLDWASSAKLMRDRLLSYPAPA